jgi:hypothetical protein
MKEEIKQLQEKAREEFEKKFGTIAVFDIKERHHYGLAKEYPIFDELLKYQDTIIEQTYKQGYFCGREDLKIEIIADFNNK